MEIEVDRNISLLDRVQIRGWVLLPVLRRLRVELGEVRANEIVRSVLRDWSRKLDLEIGASLIG